MSNILKISIPALSVEKLALSSMKLPDLPALKKKREASITPAVLEWIRQNGPPCCAVEVKACRGNTLPASALLPHQKAALLAATGGGIVHKLSDEARRKQPFDAFKLGFTKAYVVVAFLSAPRIALVIDIRKWPPRVTRATPCEYSFDL